MSAVVIGSHPISDVYRIIRGRFCALTQRSDQLPGKRRFLFLEHRAQID